MPEHYDQPHDQRVAIAVDFYDEDEKAKLLQYPRAAKIQALAGRELSVPLAEFLTYYLFYRKRPGKDGYRNYTEISQKVEKALSDLEDFVELGRGTVGLVEGSGPTITAITERIGESVGLSVVNRIHDLHEADWDKIPTHSGRRGFATFDYQTTLPKSASDGSAIVQIEAKGASGEESAKLAASVRTQVANAREKKEDLRRQELLRGYKYPASVRYATVTAVGVNRPAKCWLLDPPADVLGSPAAVRIINRMHFLTDCLSFISPRSQLAAAAQTRLWALAELRDPLELSGLPLIKGNGRPFELVAYDALSRRQGFFRNMSHIVDGAVGGMASQTPQGSMLFIGIREDLVRLLIDQDFERITRYEFPAGSMRKEVEFVFASGRARELDLPENIALDTGGTYVRFALKGTLHYSRGGMVFGLLPFEHSTARSKLRERDR